ncbi:UdgX family uracil-DNA binding protein [Dyella sedimenti]|uniref:UdgX family uracil-DNA binding protein n=1 Tax=Dyella sedimenti TaxID=2919947 RepID=UPI001FAAD4AE|nr:UdgX family uracil-DNA binding protein [Dyella sedimenti]
MAARRETGWTYPLALPPAMPAPAGTLASLRRKAGRCRACPLWQQATRTVFGVGAPDADMMLVGEQPGDREDLAGKPFVGPAGALLDRALAAAGLDRGQLYVTNAVKHFKFGLHGKRRLNQRANAREQAICRQWLAAELREVRPTRVLALGAMAAKAAFGPAFRLTAQHGQWLPLPGGVWGMATWHPSAILRSPGERERRLAELTGDLQRFAAGPAR